MSRRCAWVCKQLALYVGGDLCERDQLPIDDHLRSCEACRARADALSQSHEALVQCRTEEPIVDEVSLWPALQCRLTRAGVRERGLRSWLPIAAMIAASFTIGVIVWNRPAYAPGRSLVREESQPEWEAPDWTTRLSAPAVLPLRDPSAMPERSLPRRAQFQLESAT